MCLDSNVVAIWGEEEIDDVAEAGDDTLEEAAAASAGVSTGGRISVDGFAC